MVYAAGISYDEMINSILMSAFERRKAQHG